MIDKTGKDVLPREYTTIRRTWDSDMWVIVKDKESGLLDKDLNIVLPLAKCSIGVSDEMVSMTMPDHTMRLYDLQGNLINDFYVSSIRKLEYEKDEILIRHIVEENEGVDGPYKTITDEEYHPNATARLRAYVAGDDYEGLMTADGHKVTLPIYQNISAIGYDLYLCHVNGESHVIIVGPCDAAPQRRARKDGDTSSCAAVPRRCVSSGRPSPGRMGQTGRMFSEIPMRTARPCGMRITFPFHPPHPSIRPQ